jgi:hypothetical protein
MLFGIFDAREAEEFGLMLADTLASRFPASRQKNDRKLQTKRAELFQTLFVQARQFSQAHRLNLYKKAKLGNAFRWKLLELGYAPEFADQMTKEIMVEMK